MKTAIVIGGNFAGMTAALELKRKGKDNQWHAKSSLSNAPRQGKRANLPRAT